MIGEQAPLFGPPLPAPLPPLEERREQLESLPVPEPVLRLPRIPAARIDPIGHLSDCREEDCPDCTLLREQFARCACGRWIYKPVMFQGHCMACQIKAGEFVDERSDLLRWVPPSGLSREAA